MKIIFVAFNLNKENAVKYSKYKTIKGAMKAFEECLLDDNVQFFSIRKIMKVK